MDFTIRLLNGTDYDKTLVGWWKDWGWEAPTKDFLPSDGTGGLIVYDGEIPVCAGFVYLTNSKVSWVDWIISNKDYRGDRKEALKLLVDTLTNISVQSGSKYAYALIKHQGLIKVYEELGYVKSESYTSEMIKIL